MRLKVMIATGVVLFTATGVALGAVHVGQPSASAASPATNPQPVKTTDTVRLSERQFEQLADLLKAKVSHTDRSQHQAIQRTQARTVSAQSTARATQPHATSTATRVHHSEVHHAGVSHGSDHSQGAHTGGCDDDGAGCD